MLPVDSLEKAIRLEVFKMIGYGKSDVGLCRKRNEDSMLVCNENIGKLPNIYVIADGMGGHKAGDVASSTAVNALKEYIEAQVESEEGMLDILIGAINHANTVVYNMTKSDEQYSNMGTTITACTICGKNAYIAHVGDSRLYKISKDKITQITNDHSYVAELLRMGRITKKEAENHPDRHSITRAVGAEPTVIADGIICSILKGDIIVMCSDGLSNMVDNKGILEIANNDYMSIEGKVDRLIKLANDNGGQDNITLIVVDTKEVE